MQNELTFVRRGETIAKELASGSRVCVVSGRIWLTEPTLMADFVLGAGEEYVVAEGGRVLIDSDDRACVRILASQNVPNLSPVQ